MRHSYDRFFGHNRAGFTLVEVLAASVIGAFVAMVAVGALKAISLSAEMVDENIKAASELRFAARTISADLVNLYRDSDMQNARLIGMVEETAEGLSSYLVLYSVSRIKARASEPEGDVYEVEYHLARTEEHSNLMRRRWPNPDKDNEPGGILSVIGEDIEVFEVRFFDGQEWYFEWTEEMKSVPELMEVTIAAKEQGRDELIIETFIVNFVSNTGTGNLEAEESAEEAEGESLEDR